MMKKSLNRKLKKNKYNLILLIIFIILSIIIFLFAKSKIKDLNMSKYNDEIVIIKGGGDELKSYSIKELRKKGGTKTDIYINNGLEKVQVEGISLEKLLGDLDFNLRERPVISIEDIDGNANRFPMSIALEVDRIYLVYRIDGQPLIEYNPSYGNLAIIDKNTKNANSWITNVKTLNIQ